MTDMHRIHSNQQSHLLKKGIAVLCALLLAPSEGWMAYASTVAVRPHELTAQDQAVAAAKIPNDQLDALVAPIALYPDPLLSQVLVASTYPLEIIQLQQWLAKNKNLKDKALADAVAKQKWDPSIQATAALPDVVKQLAENITWTTELGNAFLDQQSDVMDAVQRMRAKAKDAGKLKSNEQMKVETKVVETKTVVVIEPASTQVVYVPIYNPVVVYGPPVYPYPPIYYPPPGAAIFAFSVGVAMGAAWGGHYGWGCGWGHNDVNINVHNNYNRNTNINRSGGNTWNHNPQHRGAAPYSNRSTANKYGGRAQGQSRQTSSRQSSGRSDSGRQQAGSMNRGSSGGASNLSANRGGSGGAKSIGSRDASRGSTSRDGGAFGGSSSGASARASSSRGSSSMSRGGGRSSGGRRR